MKNFKRLLVLAGLVSVTLLAGAQTDVTSLLTNPSFEADATSGLSQVTNSNDGLRGWTLTNPTGWTVSGTGVTELLVNKDCYADNNFGKITTIPDGTYAYYLRQGWNGGNTSVRQSVTLEPGTYQFSVRQRTGYANSATSTLTLVAGDDAQGVAFDQGSTGVFTTKAWTTSTLEFGVAATKTLSLGFDVTWVSGGSCVMLDQVTLVRTKDSYEEPVEPTEQDLESPTEGAIAADFVGEAAMMQDLLQMLASFSTYLVNDYKECTYPNSINEACGCFQGESTMASNEAGVRTNADLSMICAFLVKYAKPAGVTLPSGVTWERIEELALKTLVFAYSTHKANKLKVCSGNDYWGSTSNSDHVWESSLWAMSVAYSAFFQWDKLSEAQRGYIYQLLKAECNYELNRTIPTGYSGDTKAEENGWEADVLAAALGLFPDDELAPQWFERLRQFAVNSYSHTADAANTNVLDAWYNPKTVADLYVGQNLYDDYTLQNHNLFHTSYQNVVMQELGEAALALKLFQTGLGHEETWRTNALMHNNQEVMDLVLNWLALTDGELAMPNGNDWSLFLYDQITSYTTQATFQRDANALMLENLAYKYIKARQTTTEDGSWLLRPDVQARRMGVEAHRVMMTYLMHLANSTADLTPTAWEDFRAAHSEARVLRCQNIVRAFTPDRFTTFSWSNGLKSYTGYIAANSVDKNKIIVPFRANNTGNFLGWYTVSGKATDATPVVSGIYQLKGDAWVMNGELKTNASTLDNRFAIYSTPGNAVMYLDYVQGLASGTITGEYGGLMAVSVDELTKTKRTLYYNDTHRQSDGTTLLNAQTNWMNIDNAVGFVSQSDKKMAFGDRAANNSILTAKLYPSYSSVSRAFSSGSVVDRRNITYYSNITAETTATMESLLQVFTHVVPTGWNGAMAADPDGTYYLLLAHFAGNTTEATLSNIGCPEGAPVFTTETTIAGSKSTATFRANENNSVANALKIFVQGDGIVAKQDAENDEAAYLSAATAADATVTIIAHGTPLTKNISLAAGQTMRVSVVGNSIQVETVDAMPASTPSYIVNPSFDGNSTAGWSGSVTADYNEVEKYNANFDFYQAITGLEPGMYELSCQGFYRAGGYANAATLRSNGSETINASLYATSAIENASTPLCSIFDEAGKKGVIGVNTAHGYVPNTMEQAANYFAADLYPVSLRVKVGDDGTLTIGVKKSTLISSDWTIFDNFTLRRIGTLLTLSEEQPLDVAADVEHAFVTLTRNSVIGLNSVALPFDLTEEQVEAAFGEEAVVYSYSDAGDADATTVNFNSGATVVAANTPVLVKATKAASVLQADDVTVKVAPAIVEGHNYDFVGNYAGPSTVEAGCYFIKNVEENAFLYKSTGDTAIPSFRAYLAPREGGSSEVKLYIDGIATAINDLNGDIALPDNQPLYDLAGRRFTAQPPTRGIYIRGNKKVTR